MQTVLPNFFMSATLTDNLDFYHLMPFLLTLTLFWGSQGQCKATFLGFIFLHAFQVIRVEFGVVLKLFKLNVLVVHMSEIYCNMRNNSCSTDCIKKL